MKSQDRRFEVEVLVHGRPIMEYFHRGETFVEGRTGSEYTLRVHNHSDRRVVVVLSVDGLSVMNGKTASRSDGGYIIEGYGQVEVPGWRLNDKQVAHFGFARLPDAYAAKMGKPENIGVIGAVFYFEKRLPVYFNHFPRPRPYDDLLRPLVFGHSRGLMPQFESKGIGTDFGRPTDHEVHSEHFDRESSPAAELVIRYDDAEGLASRGISVGASHNTGDRVIDAKPFPGDVGATPPADWPWRK